MPGLTRRRVLAALASVMGVASVGLVWAGPAAADPDPDPVPASEASLVSTPVDPGTRLTEFALPNPSSLPNDVVAGADSSVWVSTFADKQVLRMSRDGAIVMTAQLAGGPSSLASDGEGGAWAAEYASNAIAHVSAAGVVTEYPIPTANSFPAHVYDAGDLVFFTESGTGKVGRLTESTGAIAEYPIAGADDLGAITGTGTQVWVADRNALWVLGATGAVIDYTTQVPGLTTLVATGTDAHGNQVVLGAAGTKTVQIARGPAGGAFTVDTEHYGFTDIQGLVRLGSKSWWVDQGTNSVGWNFAEGSTAQSGGWYSVASARTDLRGMATTDHRFVWTVEQASGRVQRFDTELLLPVWRYGGADRYEMSAQLQSLYFPYPKHVFIASGEVFADALSVGAFAARLDAPLLLTSKAVLPTATRESLQQWNPVAEITVVGGPASISNAVLAEIQSAQPRAKVTRVEGRDRYEVSRNLIESYLPPGSADALYIADGRNFSDALSSTSAVAHKKAAVLLVNGGSRLSVEEAALIRTFGDAGKSVTIVGGPLSVSPTIETQVAGLARVNRIGGADRYAVSLAVNDDAYPGVQSALFLASGAAFPDALTGGVVAGSRGMPLFLTPPTCVSAELVDRIRDWQPGQVILLGGPNTLTPVVESLTRCP